jgi:hypothetical protein
MIEGVNLIKIYCKHICKCHNESPLYIYHMLIKKNHVVILICIYLIGGELNFHTFIGHF